jgi:hypothetical protein
MLNYVHSGHQAHFKIKLVSPKCDMKDNITKFLEFHLQIVSQLMNFFKDMFCCIDRTIHCVETEQRRKLVRPFDKCAKCIWDSVIKPI